MSGAGGFGEASTRRVLAEACKAVGLSDRDAELIRVGQNAVFRLISEHVVVRVGRSASMRDAVRRELDIARWLADVDFPAQRIVEDIDQALVIDGRVVSFWWMLDDVEPRPSVGELGLTLRQLHGLPVPSHINLAPFRIMARVPDRIASASISHDDRVFLRDLWRELQNQYDALTFSSEHVAIHGDAQTSNILRGRDGRTYLIDFDEFALGPVECDLAVTATEYTLFRQDFDEPYERFASAYGYDVTTWDGFDVLRRINELKMTTWLMQNVGENPRIAAEFAKRICDLRRPEARRSWGGF